MPYETPKPRAHLLTMVLLSASCLLLSCTQSTGLNRSQGTEIAQRTAGQVLPITAKATIGTQTFDLEVARKPQQQAIGLMYRTFLPPNRGMLFPFNPPQPVQFWMKNCRIALDMIFLRQGKVIYIAAAAPPCTADPCPVYGPDSPVDQVIEIQSGRAAALGLKVGDRIDVQPLTP